MSEIDMDEIEVAKHSLQSFIATKNKRINFHIFRVPDSR